MIDKRFVFSSGILKIRNIGRLNHDERQSRVPMWRFGNTFVIWWSHDALVRLHEERSRRVRERQAANDNDLPTFLRGAVVRKRAA